MTPIIGISTNLHTVDKGKFLGMERIYVNKDYIDAVVKEGVQKVFGTLDLFVSLLETEIKYPILQGGILPFWTPSSAVFISQGIGSCRDRFSAPASGMTFCPWRSCP